MIRRTVIGALLLAGCFGAVPSTVGGQAKVLFSDPKGYVGHLDTTLSTNSPALDAREIHDIDVYGDYELRWAGISSGQACFKTSVVQWGDKLDPDAALRVWTKGRFVITTFDSREELLAARDFPHEGTSLTGEVTKTGLTANNHFQISLKLCGTPTNVKDTAHYLAVLEVPRDAEHIGGLYLWELDGAPPSQHATEGPPAASSASTPATEKTVTANDVTRKDVTGKDLVAAVAAQDDLKTFSRWLGSSGLGDTLHGPGPFTVFALTDASLAKLPSDAQKIANSDPQKLRAMMNRFVVSGSYPSASMERSNQKQTLDTSYKVSFGKRSNGAIEVAGDKVVREIATSNGVLYVVSSPR
jgi:uncharacterized surface protein with fasciclin (FAS1) repeats